MNYKEIRETSPFTIGTNYITYVGITKQMDEGLVWQKLQAFVERNQRRYQKIERSHMLMGWTY